VSEGVDLTLTQEIRTLAIEQGLDLVGVAPVGRFAEVEAGWILCPGTVIAVTGTNGKTTVTTLIGKILEAQGRKSCVCGNIGNPFCQEVEKIDKDTFVSLEISSFQLERIKEFKPNIAVMLNFSSNHLDRYKDVRHGWICRPREGKGD